jgi:hypothetical protein
MLAPGKEQSMVSTAPELYMMLLEPECLRILWLTPNGDFALQKQLGRSPVGVPVKECALLHGRTGFLRMLQDVAKTGTSGHLSFSSFAGYGERWSTDLTAHRLPSGEVLMVEQFVRLAGGE